jgi:hypothetical protein
LLVGYFCTTRAGRYHAASRAEKKAVLDEFIEFINVTGFHRKHAIRALKRNTRVSTASPAPRSRLYDQAVKSALTILWEAADRICGKRLKQAIPTLWNAMERHGHLQLDEEVRRRLLTMSAATMDESGRFRGASCIQASERKTLRGLHGPPAACVRGFTLACYTQEYFTNSKTLTN